MYSIVIKKAASTSSTLGRMRQKNIVPLRALSQSSNSKHQEARDKKYILEILSNIAVETGFEAGIAAASYYQYSDMNSVILNEAVKYDSSNHNHNTSHKNKYRSLPPQKYSSSPPIEPHPIEHINGPPLRTDLPILSLEEVK